MLARSCVALVSSLLLGCSLDRAGVAGAARVDGGTVGPRDAEAVDATADAGAPDAGPPDAYVPPVLCPVDPDLVACWPLDGDGVDRGGRGNDLEVTAVTWEPAGGVLLGMSSGLVRASRPEIRHTRLAVDGWLRVDAFPPAGARAGIIDHDGQFGMFVGPGGEIRCAAAVLGAAALSVPGALSEGVWHHVACAGDGASVSLYVDAMAVASTPASASGTAGDAPLQLGENAPDGADQLVGALDDVRLWDRPRSAAEVQDDFARGRVLVAP